jgi:integrase
LIDKLDAAGLSAQTIISYTKVIKMVVASAVNAEGEEIYPRKWNHDFVGMPILRKEDQHRPTTETEISEILASTQRRYAVLFALPAGSGLRIGKALALKSTDLSPDCRVVFVRRSIWRGKEQEPKTPAAVREVDLPESLARVMLAHAEDPCFGNDHPNCGSVEARRSSGFYGCCPFRRHRGDFAGTLNRKTTAERSRYPVSVENLYYP